MGFIFACLQVGVHSQLRTTAETVLLEVAVVGSRVEALSFLFWTPGCGDALYKAMTHSIQQLSALVPAQVNVLNPFSNVVYSRTSPLIVTPTRPAPGPGARKKN